MQGYNTLWLPGTDHAGIATQNVVERLLHKQGLKKEDIGREEFIKRVWQWKYECGERIISQLKRLGCSCDWSRLKFTMDKDLTQVVNEVFVRLYKEGLIYKDYYIVNWCCRCKTALADIEVEHHQIQGKLYYIKYPLLNKPGYITIATTRPETMLADTAVAVNPEDDRYKPLIGESVILPLMEREIKIIPDKRVKPEFGTGAVKITPCHDPVDFQIGKSHNLQFINILNKDGTMNENAKQFQGLDRFTCRVEVVKALKEKNLIEKIEDNYLHAVGHCYRCHNIIEPYYSEQWFVKTQELAKEAIKVVKEDKIRFIPSNWTKVYFDWMENIKDWCISRQIWWGHRIPVWYCKDCNHQEASVNELKTCPNCNSKNIYQDEDVLDTWFSSALWPFSTLGWLKNSKDYKTFYPTSLLSTGFDIIFFWVARMIMMGLKFTNNIPFREVYIHPLIKDEFGKKMSKSKGNIIDPLQIIEKYGADALRFTLASLLTQAKDVLLSEEKIKGARHFCNKLWNAARFILLNVTPTHTTEDITELNLDLADRWIQTRLSQVVEEVTQCIEEYRFDTACFALYNFIWHEYCDWYLEIAKLNLNSRPTITKYVLVSTFDKILRLLHPFIPFITEELWQKLPINREKPTIMLSTYPKPEYKDLKSIKDIEIIKKPIIGIRQIRHDMKIAPQVSLEVLINSQSEEILSLLKEYSHYIGHLASCKYILIDKDLKRPEGSASYITQELQVYIPLQDILDVQTEIKRLKKEIEKVDNELRLREDRLSDEKFLKKAPQEVVNKEKTRRDELLAHKSKLLSLLEQLIN
jgi:valyl-tRNA synthetase